MEDTGAGYLAQHASRVRGHALGELPTYFTIERSFRIEKIRTVEHPSDHIPLGEAYGVIPHCIQNSAVHLPLCLCMRGAGRAMPQCRRAWSAGCPLCEFLSRRIAQGVMQPDSTQPAISLRVRHSHLLRPRGRQLCHPLDVLYPVGGDDGPLGQRRTQPRRRGARRERH